MSPDPEPAARLDRFSPIFPVRDLARALAHYRSLGFVTTAYGDGEAYGFADRDGIGLHLAADEGHDPTTDAGRTYLYVDERGRALRGVGPTGHRWPDPAGRRHAVPAAGGIARRPGRQPHPVRLADAEPAGGAAGRATSATGRPGGAWHHLADGRPTAELAAAAGQLAAARELVADGEEDAYRLLCDEVDRLDGGAGLPEAFTHPDFVMANVVASPDGIVVVDWAGAGRAPRLWSLAFLLYAEGAKDLRRVDRVVAGYRQHVRPEPEELDRLTTVMRARPLVFVTWAVCTGRSTAADAVAGLAELHSLTEAIADRARAASPIRSRYRGPDSRGRLNPGCSGARSSSPSSSDPTPAGQSPGRWTPSAPWPSALGALPFRGFCRPVSDGQRQKNSHEPLTRMENHDYHY